MSLAALALLIVAAPALWCETGYSAGPRQRDACRVGVLTGAESAGMPEPEIIEQDNQHIGRAVGSRRQDRNISDRVRVVPVPVEPGQQTVSFSVTVVWELT
jgi:hypothetical protein